MKGKIRSTVCLIGMLLIAVLLAVQGCGSGLSTTSEPRNIYFPQLKPVSGEREFMEAQLIGELVVVNDCIYMNSREGDTSYLVIWPPEFTLVTENDLVQIRNGVGEVVAQVGEEVYMSGGEVPASEAPWLSQQLREKLPDTCPGPYWVVGEQVRFFESVK